jgi:hypothetical protein
LSSYPSIDIRELYHHFNSPVTHFDCGEKCAPQNPHAIPFCCDICQAVPAVYINEWEYLKEHTDLWHIWQGSECKEDVTDPQELGGITPSSMILLACLGPRFCQREFRAISCRQFPFIPYINFRDKFIGMTYDWEFAKTCWVISHLEEVTIHFRQEFFDAFDLIFQESEEEFDNYAVLSEQIREIASKKKHRIPLLHRNGRNYLLSPKSERLRNMASTPVHKILT